MASDAETQMGSPSSCLPQRASSFHSTLMGSDPTTESEVETPPQVRAQADAEAKCVICMDSIYDAVEACQYLSCGHQFHAECVSMMMQQLSIVSLDDVRCPECRLTPNEVNAQTIDMLHDDPVYGGCVVQIEEDSQPVGQPDVHEQAVPAGQDEPSAAEPMTDGFLKVFHCPAVSFS